MKQQLSVVEQTDDYLRSILGANGKCNRYIEALLQKYATLWRLREDDKAKVRSSSHCDEQILLSEIGCVRTLGIVRNTDCYWRLTDPTNSWHFPRTSWNRCAHATFRN